MVEKEITPKSRTNVDGNYASEEQTILYAFLTLKPVGGIRQKYKIDDNANEFR